jgi:peptidoglycan hydrolase-like amidase
VSSDDRTWPVNEEPIIRVGLVIAPTIRFDLAGHYKTSTGEILGSGNYEASSEGHEVRLGGHDATTSVLTLSPLDPESCRATIHDVTIGVDFHWQQRESQQFQGNIVLVARPEGLLALNELPLENYLVSVISSEMSASCPQELLCAHAIVSRSWLLAQMQRKAPSPTANAGRPPSSQPPATEIIRWYDRESHEDFDVCADDHCQRYQGISKAFSAEVFDAVRSTRGRVLMFEGEVCDTRYSKSCGGMTEEFRAAWEDRDVPYLSAIYDGTDSPALARKPLDVEVNAGAWIESVPPAFCNTRSTELLSRILPSFDQQTLDFYRWRIVYTQEELSEIVGQRLGVDLGRITELKPLLRGKSGRIVRLHIIGSRGSLVVGKELEIRRTLSRSHLYSSAFVVQTEKRDASEQPEKFTLIGAGWGHGVGLCQIGAAVMADSGDSHQQILQHYFTGAELRSIY